jgi:fatty acid desaturase
MRIPVRGTAALVTAVVIVAATLIWLPAYRWFFAISVGMGVVVATVLYLWHKFRPVREEDIEKKRPLGLS